MFCYNRIKQIKMKIESFLHKVFLFILFFMIEKFVIFET